jgi:beta-glucosidase
MCDIGLKSYRMSLSWSRLLPEGIGSVNQQGVEFYKRLVGGLLENGIQPLVTLFHWDFPEALYTRGGWLNRDSISWFAEYAAVAARQLPDVNYWITLNEPVCCIEMGHRTGVHAPGDRLDLPMLLRAGHHLMCAHGAAVRAIRACGDRAQIGLANTAGIRFPASNSHLDIDAARCANFVMRPGTLWGLPWWSDPPYLGEWPEDGLLQYGAMMPRGFERDRDLIAAPLDFFGLNVYTGDPVCASNCAEGFRLAPIPPGAPEAVNGWRIEPDAIGWGARYCHERYGVPVIITENGYPGNDWVDFDGRVADYQRIDCTRRALLSLAQAMAGGVDVRGYIHWSLMDNFEWAEGFRIRYGLVHVDFSSLKRTPKESARWYEEVISSGGSSLGAAATQAEAAVA